MTKEKDPTEDTPPELTAEQRAEIEKKFARIKAEMTPERQRAIDAEINAALLEDRARRRPRYPGGLLPEHHFKVRIK